MSRFQLRVLGNFGSDRDGLAAVAYECTWSRRHRGRSVFVSADELVDRLTSAARRTACGYTRITQR